MSSEWMMALLMGYYRNVWEIIGNCMGTLYIMLKVVNMGR